MRLTRRMAPTDPAVARLQIQGGRAEAKRSHVAVLADDQVAQLRPAQRSVSQIVMRRYQFLPLQVQLTVLSPDQNQLKLAKLFDRALKSTRHIQSNPSKARSAKAHRAARRWQIDQSALGQSPQRHPTAHLLALVALGAPVQPIADSARQLRPRPLRLTADRRVDALQNLVRKNSPAHHHTCIHLRILCHKSLSVSSIRKYGT